MEPRCTGCRSVLPLLPLVILCLCLPAAGDLFQAPLGPSGTWNLYETERVPASWADAVQQATERAWLLDGASVSGTLVSITSPAENRLVESLVSTMGTTAAWIGLTDREGAAPRIDPPLVNVAAPQESAFQVDPQLDGWAWTSGEPVAYVNWGQDFPRNSQQRADAAFILIDGRWGDEASGFLGDLPIPPTLQPETSPDENRRIELPFVIEYPLSAEGPLPAIPVLSLFRMPPRLPGVAAELGQVGVTDFLVNEAPVSILAAASMLAQIESGVLTPLAVAAGQYDVADLTDPDATKLGGTFAGQPLPNPSNVAGQREHDVLTVAQGTFHVEQAGTYSFRVETSGSFVLRIDDAAFREVRGLGQIDELDPALVYFADRSLDAETVAVVDLVAGYHDLQLIASSPNARHYWELSTARGAILDGVPAQWIPIGADVSFSPRPVVIPAVLTEPATVVSLRAADGGDVADVGEARWRVGAADPSVLSTRDDVTTLIIHDVDGICCGRLGGRFVDTYEWPVDQPGVPSDNFASLISGTLRINDGDQIENESLEITFAVLSDDAADLWIQGASFVAGDFATDLSFDIDGDFIMRSRNAGAANSIIRGTIWLQEGIEYDFEAAHYDSTGDAGFELFSALGSHIDSAGLDTTLFFPLSTMIFTKEIAGNRALKWGPLAGDYNRNGSLDVDDLQRQIQAIASQDDEFDLDGDLVVTAADLKHWVVELKLSWIGDANLDGEYNSSDLVEVLTQGRYETGERATWSQGDWNGDQRFSSSDLIASFADGGYELGPRAGITAVPEPRAACPLLLAFVSVVVSSRR